MFRLDLVVNAVETNVSGGLRQADGRHGHSGHEGRPRNAIQETWRAHEKRSKRTGPLASQGRNSSLFEHVCSSSSLK
nr:hypothetical protein CFP56_07538 [Quercus suber]